MIEITEWCDYTEQTCTIGNCTWSVPSLIHEAKDLEVFDMPLEHLNIANIYPSITSTTMYLKHVHSILVADLEYPVILDQEGEIMDGRHRIANAILKGLKTIKCVRFVKNPEPTVYKGE